jgi:hypothetical protein
MASGVSLDHVSLLAAPGAIVALAFERDRGAPLVLELER